MKKSLQCFIVSILCTAILSVTMVSCKSDSPSPSNSTGGNGGGGGGGGTSNPAALFFRARIENDSINYTEGANNFASYVGVEKEIMAPDNWIVYTSTIIKQGAIKDYVSLTLGNIHLNGSTQATTNEFWDLYNVGSISYATTDVTEDFEGVKLQWVDPDGNYWNTIGDQSSSSFTITGVTKTPATTFTEATVMVQANFNCKLYNEDDGSSITLKNGSLKLTFSNEE